VLALLSPAKKLDFASPLPEVRPTDPQLVDDLRLVLAAARKKSKAELAELMDLSDDLATSTFERFRDFEEEGGRPAILAFAGDVYQGLRASTLSVQDLEWAQSRLAILSGLYGFLRPLDRIRPYRLEMGTKLANPRGKDLYAFWSGVLAPLIDRTVAEHSDPTVVNLASDEYFSAVDRKRLQAGVITPVFQDVKNGKARAVFLFVKRARGAMARWIVENRVERAADLRDAEIDGYRFVAEASDDARWVYRRDQPPPVG
jgi:hypothetical protein